MEEMSAFAFHSKSKKSKKGAKKIVTESLPLTIDEKRRIHEELALMKKILNQKEKEKMKNPVSSVETKQKKKKTSSKKNKLSKNISPTKVILGLKNGLSTNQIEFVKLKSDHKSSKISNEDTKKENGHEKGNKVTLIQSVKEVLRTSKERSSADLGRQVLSMLVHPMSVDKFLSTKFSKQHHVFVRNDKSYHDEVFSTKDLDSYIKSGKVWFGKNLDVTSYEDGKRETHNPDGKASGPIVWTLYNDGCSLRLLNPQTFNENVWMLCATLQEFFGSMVGANVYLTPPGTQGFAPHFDDVDVFIMQLEGCKHWRLYGPRNPEDVLPRFSSPNFDQAEIGKPIADVVLQPGDMIYLPRGTIHQATCLPDHHSLHITVSCNQLNTYGDLMQKMLTQALETAMRQDVEFRETLPQDYLRLAGSAFKDRKNAGRNVLLSKTEHLFKKLFSHASIDHGADELGKRFMTDVLPPFLTNEEKQRTVAESGFNWCPKKARVVDDVPLPEDAHVRLVRGNCLRLVEEDGCFKLFHCVENSREYHEVEGAPWELPDNHAPVVKKLLQNYPSFTPLEEFSLEELEAVDQLWANSLLIAKNSFSEETQALEKKTKSKKSNKKVMK